jgi:hypothetical protein
LSPLYTAAKVEYVATAGAVKAQVATPAFKATVEQPVIGVELLLKLTVPVALLDETVAVSVLTLPYTGVLLAALRVVVVLVLSTP